MLVSIPVGSILMMDWNVEGRDVHGHKEYKIDPVGPFGFLFVVGFLLLFIGG
jgi:hypothetical protein